MRSPICIGLAALILGGCGGGDGAGNDAATERNVTSEVAPTNDVTAIDAATGQAANMAADVDYLPADLNQANASSDSAASNPPARPPRPSPPARPPAAEPRGSDAADDPANANTL